MNNNLAKLKKITINFIYRMLIIILITIVLLILMKKNISFKKDFYKYVYDTNISFSKISNLYNKYFKDFTNNLNNKNIKKVSNEKINYIKKEKYEEGVRLTVSSNYSIQVQESGIIVYKGLKEPYGNVIIIQQINGIDLLYGNIDTTNYKIYDYVNKGDILGSCNNELYLLFKKNGKVIDYEKYI